MMTLDLMNTQTFFLVAAICLVGPVVASEPLFVDDMIVTAIESVDVPATQTGVIDRLNVREGDPVVVGDVIAALDDRDARVKESIAQTQLDMTRRRADGNWQSEIAGAKLDAEKQAAAQQAILENIASTKAASDVRVQASKKAADAAQVELDRALRSQQRYAESVSKSEIDGLRLAHERSLLEIKQAEAERNLDRMAATAEAAATVGHRKNIERFAAELQQSLGQEEIAHLESNLATDQLELARLQRQQHVVASPIDGVVADVHSAKGDWITTGQPIARIIRLDRLRAEGFVGLDQLPVLRTTKNVNIRVQIGTAKSVERVGKIVFISPEVDPVNNEIRFWVEFDNTDRVILPGMRMTMETTP